MAKASYLKRGGNMSRRARGNLRAVRKQATKQAVKKEAAKESTYLRGIKQGAGMVVKKAFQTGRGNAPKNEHQALSALCALTNKHLSLPRAVGSYTVVKTTTTINTGADSSVIPKFMLFGPMKQNREHYTDNVWSTVLALGSVDENQLISAQNNTIGYGNLSLMNGGFSDSRMVPSAVTLQVMNPEAIQQSAGMLYIGRTKQVIDACGDNRSWAGLREKLISFSAPRLCSAGKLALRGVQVDCIPYNMSVLSDFCPVDTVQGNNPSGFLLTWAEGSNPDNFSGSFEGFAPIFVHNPNQVPIQFLLTIEWRCRFDPINAAYAGHSYHPVTSDSTWSKVISTMESAGHGVIDIASAVADFGEAHPNMVQMARG